MKWVKLVATLILGLGSLAVARAAGVESREEKPGNPPTKRPADLILTGGVVVTLEKAQARASALAVREGRIVSVGSDAEIEALAGPSTRRIPLAGKTVVPGWTDAHVHVESLGAALESLDLVGAESLEEALRRVGERAKATPAGEWILGQGWDQNDWPEKRFPRASDLDRVAGGRPVYLGRVDGHAAWVNSAALARAGVGPATPDPTGGRILRDEKGNPEGVLVDAAEALVFRSIPAPRRDVRKRRIANGLRACAEVGLTSVHDAGVDVASLELYKELLAEGKLDVRVYVMVSGPEAFLSADKLRPEVGLGDGHLTVRAIKVVADGALGSRGALLQEPYSDEPGSRGLSTVDGAAFRRLIARALTQGFQVNTHAIGDAANRQVLDAYEQAFGPGGGARHRFRIEHAQVLSPTDVPRFKQLGVIPSMQPTHCTSDMYWAEARLGPERVKGAYLWKTFLDAGVRIAGGSDAPVEAIAVLPGIYAAVTRQDAKGWPQGGWHPEERVSSEDALRMFSADAAYAAFEEADRGSIAPGKRADLTILNQDVTRVAPAEILKTRVTLTMVGGKVVHGE